MTSVAQSQSTSSQELRDLTEAATTAFGYWSRTSPQERAEVLESIASALDASGSDLIPLAQQETHLTTTRLTAELKRTTFQLRIFGQVLREGSYLDARIDHADSQWPMGAPRPDLRRMRVPLGPVAVYSASNFPFAFSIAGGDTASALAAGNPVVVKAHSGHLLLSAASERVVQDALIAAGAPAGLFSVIYGTEAGRELISDPRIKAAGFTGSIPGGRALFDLAQQRPEPIPFYGELGSNNPVFVTPAAAAAEGEQIVKGFIQSFTNSAGQFCTKPGTIFVPESSDLVQRLRNAVLPKGAQLLNQRIHSGYVEALEALSGHPSVSVLQQGTEPFSDRPSPTLLLTSATSLLEAPQALQEECFGPSALVVTYGADDDLAQLAATYTGQLSATIHATEACDTVRLVKTLVERAGRILWNQWPTGVSVSFAQQHGGPYPATTAPGSTSVGTAAIERFLRPVTYQGFPDSKLPEPLQEDNPWNVPRKVDGVVVSQR